MSTFNINIPYSGSFDGLGNTNPYSLYSTDLTYLNNDIFVAYVQQYDQGIGYIVVYEFTDLSNTTEFTNESLEKSTVSQRILHTGNAYGVKLFKIATNRIMCIVDGTVYILDFTGTNYVVSRTSSNFFVTGMQSRNNAGALGANNANMGNYYLAESLKENELLIVDNENPVSAANANYYGDFKFYRVVYNPGTTALTKTLVKNFTTDLTLTPTNEFPTFGGGINRIPNTNTAYMYFTKLPSRTVPGSNYTSEQRIVYSARIDLEGNELATYTIPGIVSAMPLINGDISPPQAALGLQENTVIYFHNLGIYQVLHEGTVYKGLANTSIPAYNQYGVGGPDMHFKLLDNAHFLASWSGSDSGFAPSNGLCEYNAVFKLENFNLLTTRGNKSLNAPITYIAHSLKTFQRLRTNPIMQYNNNTYIIHANTEYVRADNNSPYYPRFTIRRISF